MCGEGDTAATVFRRLVGLDAAATSFSRVIAGVAKLSPSAPLSVSDIKGLLLAALGPEPVLVVEMAERLETKELKSLLDVAKELVDKRRGRFVFVFSPTDKFAALRRFGSLSRAEVVHVGELSRAETAAFLTLSGCDADRAESLYALTGGHLPHLDSLRVFDYCRGATALSDVKGELFADIGGQLEAIDGALGDGEACGGLCSVMYKSLPSPAVLNALVQDHIVVASLRRGNFVESSALRAYATERCSCPVTRATIRAG